MRVRFARSAADRRRMRGVALLSRPTALEPAPQEVIVRVAFSAPDRVSYVADDAVPVDGGATSH
jgi:hypothetical protein